MKKYLKYVVLIVLLISLQTFFQSLIPSYMAKNIDTGILKEGVEHPYFSEISFDTAKTIDKNLLSNYEMKSYGYEIKDGVDTKLLEKETKKAFNKDEDSIKKLIAIENKKLKKNTAKNFILLNSAKMFVAVLLSALFVVLSNLVNSYFMSKYAKDLRTSLFNKIENFSTYNLSNFGSATLLTRVTNDVNKIQMSLSMIIRFGALAPFIFIFSSYQAYILAKSLTPVLIILSLIIVVILIIALYFTLPLLKLFRLSIDSLNGIVKEILSGKRVIRAFRKQNYESNKFEDVNTYTLALNRKLQVIICLVNPMISFLFDIAAPLIIIFYIQTSILGSENVLIGSVIAFIQYATNIIVSFLLLSQIFFVIPDMLISYNRVNDILNEKILITDENFAKDIKKIDKLCFKNVSFNYPGSLDNVLTNINFTLNSNETLGITGSIGSGKSTIANLVIRMLDVSSGEILLNDENIKNYTLKSIRDRISYTPQTSKLLNASIKDNICFFDKNLDLEFLKTAITYADATDFADLDMILNQNATNLSGGQKQRLCIARSIYKKPDILIFDDSFSALDNKTDKKIRDNLDNLPSMKIIIAQKISTIMNCNKIMVLHEGNIVGFGNHDELLQTCDVYKQIYETQVGGAL